MRRIGILLFVFAIALTSCSKDDDQTPLKYTLIGKWEHDFIQEFPEMDLKEVFTFKSDGTGLLEHISSVEAKQSTHPLIWTTSNNLLTLDFEYNGEIELDSSTRPYEISGNQLIINYNSKPFVYIRK